MTRRPFGLLGLSALVFAVAVLVAGGLGWVTVSSLKIEDDQRRAAALAERSEKERLALWRLDSRIYLSLGLEGYRKYEDYTALYSPPGEPPDGTLYLSRLVEAEIPEWMWLHVQLDPSSGWSSPQVLPANAVTRLAHSNPELNLSNLTDDNRNRLADWNRRIPPKLALAALKDLDSDLPDSSAIMVAAMDANPELKRQASRGAMPPQTAAAETPPPSSIAPIASAKGQTGNSSGRVGANVNPPFVGNTLNAPGQLSQGAKGQADTNFEQDQINRKNYNEKSMEGIRGGLGKTQRINPVNPNFIGPPTPEHLKSNEDKWEKQTLELRGIAPSVAPQPLTPASPGFGGGSPRGGMGGPQPVPAAKAAPPATTPLPAPEIAGGAIDRTPRDAAKQSEKKVEEFKKKTESGEANKEKEESSRQENQSVKPFRFGEGHDIPLAIQKPAPSVPALPVDLGPMRPKWIVDAEGQDVLVVFRPARLEGKVVYQGIWLDWERLRQLLKEEFIEDFPEASLVPSRETGEAPQHQLTSLPVRFESGPAPVPTPAGWTPLRLGLSLAWLAAAISLVAVWFGGWSLVDLSERRIRFVSAVTHELRTPLTSLRLYLDMLTSGMITDEVQKREYLTTLSHESNRLNQLIENVLDFAKLEKRGASLAVVSTPVWELLEPIRETWHDRLAADGKELVIISTVPPEQRVVIDPRIVQQILGNLIDNARKYTPGAADPRIWVWIKPAGRRVAFEVEDRGQGIPVSERRSIFRPFRRGGTSGATGGAGLGLALAKQWADSLGGRLIYRQADGGVGSCFRLELPS